ncbi:uncharacterized protein LOC117083806 [Trachypithecus francoisi]|uniref:uncharacterized protein LOC117083806 n=1 Tax=Trachypithecus francoisi TaxID=54180 RepID=UPI00141B68B0|nr:uncharacterized protein LOC117083806 [Trachypithecus francoisi]
MTHGDAEYPGGNFRKKQTVSHGLPRHRPPYGQDEPHVLTKHFLGLNESHLPCGRVRKSEMGRLQWTRAPGSATACLPSPACCPLPSRGPLLVDTASSHCFRALASLFLGMGSYFSNFKALTGTSFKYFSSGKNSLTEKRIHNPRIGQTSPEEPARGCSPLATQHGVSCRSSCRPCRWHETCNLLRTHM